MKDLPTSAQSAIEYGVVALLLMIIIAGSYSRGSGCASNKFGKKQKNTGKAF